MFENVLVNSSLEIYTFRIYTNKCNHNNYRYAVNIIEKNYIKYKLKNI